jgi:hypothetical protein
LPLGEIALNIVSVSPIVTGNFQTTPVASPVNARSVHLFSLLVHAEIIVNASSGSKQM